MADNFNQLRAFVNHTLLRNDFLSRLGVTADYYTAESDLEKEQALGRALDNISPSDRNLQFAIAVWNGDGHRKGISTLVLELYSCVSNMEDAKPTSAFPGLQQVQEWLAAVKEYLDHSKSLAQLTPDQRRLLVIKAGAALRQVCDFLGALDVNSPEFWRLFSLSSR